MESMDTKFHVPIDKRILWILNEERRGFLQYFYISELVAERAHSPVTNNA